MTWFNFFGFCVLILLLIPNIIYVFKHNETEKSCPNLYMGIIEKIGRYGTIALMCVHVRGLNYGFFSRETFLIWAISTVGLILLYWCGWVIYFVKSGRWIALYLSIIPSIIFIGTGIFMRYVLLVLFACLFAVGHCYMTFMNNKE